LPGRAIHLDEIMSKRMCFVVRSRLYRKKRVEAATHKTEVGIIHQVEAGRCYLRNVSRQKILVDSHRDLAEKAVTTMAQDSKIQNSPSRNLLCLVSGRR